MIARALIVAGLLALPLAGGCASGSALDRPFAAGELAEVARIFEADSSLHLQEGALFRASLAYALPESGAYHPERALKNLDRLLTLFPGTTHRPHALQLRQLLHEVREAERRQSAEVEALAARTREQQLRIDELEARLAAAASRADTLQALADRLDREAQARETRIRALQEELNGLKEIDLNRRRAQARPRGPE
jgi:hypothetical protein